MMSRSSPDNTVLHRRQTKAAIQADTLSELYWLIQVIEAGSFSAAAERTGVAKSSLSRHVKQLETRLGVQLLYRSTRAFSVTTIGNQIYRHALDMLAAAEAAEAEAQESNGTPSGLIQMAAPGILGNWLLGLLTGFQACHPNVRFALTAKDALIELSSHSLDLSLSLDEAPADSSEIVARPLASLQNVIVGCPALLDRLDNPRTLDKLEDSALLALGPPQALRPWRLSDTQRILQAPAFSAQSLQTLREAAKAGIGLACLPLNTCLEELATGALRIACAEEALQPATLYALTPSSRAITRTTRSFIQHIRSTITDEPWQGISSL